MKKRLKYQNGAITRNLNNSQVTDLNRNKSFAGLEVTPDFGKSGYFITEEQQRQQDAAKLAQEQMLRNQQLNNVVDVTSDGQFTNRKVWHTQRPEWFVGKQEAVEGKDYTTVPYKQWDAYQQSPAYSAYLNRNKPQQTVVDNQMFQFGGFNTNIPTNIGYTPPNMSLQPTQSAIQSAETYSLGTDFAQRNPLPTFGSNGFNYDPNAVDPNNKPSSVLKPYDAPLTDTTTANENFEYFNPYGGFDIPSAAYMLGQGIETGNAFDIATSGVKLATGLGRNLVSGMGQANRRESIMKDFQEKARAASRPIEQSLQNGGNYMYAPPQNYYQDGGEQGQGIEQQVASALQQGAQPEQVVQQLISMGVEEAQAVQIVQSVAQQLGGQEQMMQNGGISKKKEESLVATNEYVGEVAEGTKVAEVESGEFIKKPNGEIQQVIGDTHSNGGVKLTAEQLPENSKIISDHLKVGKEGVKKFNNDYDLGIKSTDTYATILEKYNKKTGLNKIIDEQEVLTSKLQKQAEKLLNNPNLEQTLKLNIDFLTQEFQELELSKQPILENRKIVFDEVFQPQEESKTGHNFEENLKPIPGDEFQQGGLYNGDMILEYSKKYNLPTERIKELITSFQNGGLQKYQNGVKTVTSGTNVYSKLKREDQHANQTAFGDEEAQKLLQELYNNFPNIINSDSSFKSIIEVSPKGVIKIKENTPLNKQNQLVNNTQRLIDESMRDSSQVIINNPNQFSPEAVAEAKRYFEEETFSDDPTKAVRGYDSKLGNFTGGRYSMSMNLVTPEERQMLADQGVTTVKQLKNSALRPKLSVESLKNLDNVDALIGDTSADYGIGEITPEDKPLETKSDPEKPAFTGNTSAEKTNYGLLSLPDQSPLLPDSLQGALKINRRYDRVEAPLVSPDAQVNEIRRQEAATMESLNSLPDAQRAAAIAQVQANTQAQLNNIMGQVAGQNQAATFQANAANAQIQAREEDARAIDLQSYENKILRADALTQQNLRNYYNTAQKVNLTNYNTVQGVNWANKMYANSQLTPQGIQNVNLENAPDYAKVYPPTEEKTKKKIQVTSKKKRFGGTK